jgi:4-amino-4-deoxy-L-arabinose transferase-like glycosyltransferase
MRKNILLFSIILVALFLRFWQLGQNPPSLTWDEAAWGYNAYSLGIDGRDEFGRFLPLDYLESFGDFKPPMYAYLDVVPVKLLGLNEFATRFPSALFGVLTVLATFFLTQRIFYKSKFSKSYALFASGILAVSPWHIMLSRAAFEANVASFFLICGVWLFLAGVQEKKWHLILSAVSFALSIYTFNTARIVTPLLVLVLTIGFWRPLLERKKQVVLAIIIGAILVLPTLKFLFSPQAQLRFREVNIFSDIGVIKTANREIAYDNNAWWSKIIHNRRILYGVEFVRHYFDNLSPNFLFIKGDGNPKFSTQDVGEMYLWDLPFIVIGAIFIFRKREGSWWIIPLWLILGIIPAATARETPHALRIETTLPTFQILIAVGIVEFLSWLRRIQCCKQIRLAIITLISLSLFLNVAYYLHGYLNHYAVEFSGEWQYGYKESIGYVKSVQGNYDNIYITSELGRPYIYYLFYTKTNPDIFRRDSVIRRDAFGFVTVDRFWKYNFINNTTKIDNKKDSKNLFIQTPANVSANAKILKTFTILNGNIVLVAYE